MRLILEENLEMSPNKIIYAFAHFLFQVRSYNIRGGKTVKWFIKKGFSDRVVCLSQPKQCTGE